MWAAASAITSRPFETQGSGEATTYVAGAFRQMDYSKADGQPAKCPARPKPSGVIAPRKSELGQKRS
jgi:hypothetical protein